MIPGQGCLNTWGEKHRAGAVTAKPITQAGTTVTEMAGTATSSTRTLAANADPLGKSQSLTSLDQGEGAWLRVVPILLPCPHVQVHLVISCESSHKVMALEGVPTTQGSSLCGPELVEVESQIF